MDDLIRTRRQIRLVMDLVRLVEFMMLCYRGTRLCQGPLKDDSPGRAFLSTVPNCDHLNKTFSRSDFTSLHLSHPHWAPPRQLECVVSVPLAIVN